MPGYCQLAYVNEQDQSELKQCANCGRIVRNSFPPEKIFRACTAAVSDPIPLEAVPPEMSPLPPIAQRIRTYRQERRRWVKAGKPVRSPERVAEIFETLCRPCEHFRRTRDEAGACAVCGCGIKKAGKLLNKALFATASCPLPQPKWTADV